MIRKVHFCAALVASAVLAITLPVAAQQPGTISDPVVTTADSRQSYALYLPSTYTPAKRWPLIIAFDPEAHGRVPVELFQPAAAQYGYIVAGSNNSQNGARGPEADAFRAMLRDLEERFSIDHQRVYAAGFSGAARVAGFVGFLCRGCIHAVIACGAGLPGSLTPEMRAQLPPYFFAVGNEDFNYFEVLDTARTLPSARQLVVFDGPHRWPPAEVLGQAVKWIDSGANARNIAPPAPGESKERKEQEGLTRELSRLLAAVMQESESDTRETQIADARREMANLRTRGDHADPSEARVFRRALAQVKVQALQEADDFERQKETRFAALLYEVAAEGSPQNAMLAYTVASTWAAAGDKKKSLNALKHAADLGFHDGALLAADKNFDSVRNRPEYKAIVEAMH